MAEENETSSGKKRRIIHWNPQAGREQVKRRWTWQRIVGWGVGGFFAILIAAGLVIRGLKLVLGPDVFTGGPVATGAGPNLADATAAFVTQANAEQAQAIAGKTLAQLRRMPADHPVQMQQMILMEKSFAEAELMLSRRAYARAFMTFEALSGEMEAFSTNVKIKGEAKQSYDSILLRIKDLEVARDLAPGSLEAAFEAAGQGRQLLTDGNFTGAKKIFDQGFAEL